MIRVVTADDSALFRSILKAALESDPGIKVVGQAADGLQAVELVTRLKPDVVTLDVIMPGLDGFQATERIMERQPTPILVVSTLERDSILFRMLAAGALDVAAKPDAPTLAALEPLVEKVKQLGQQGLRPRRTVSPPPPPTPREKTDGARGAASRVVVITSSAGGPQALAQVLSALPAGLPAGVLIVQHIAAGFTAGLAQWLNGLCALPVTLAAPGQIIAPGAVLVAPDSAHLSVTAGRQVHVDHETGQLGFLRPAADVTLRAAAQVYGSDLLAVVLTGMGRDGAAGVEVVKAHGGRVVVQDEATSAVWGMPEAARPFADAELPLADIAGHIIRFAREQRH